MEDNAFKFMMEAAKDLEKGKSKTFTCPICGGTANAFKSSYNGHIAAHCEKCGFAVRQ